MSVPIDLHCHSTVSDGLFAPADLVAYAAERGVKVLALTDHDDVGGLQAAQAAAKQHGIVLINGVEISVTWKKRTIHIVGLKIDADDKALNTALQQVRASREQRAKRIAEKLAEVGIEGAYEGAKQLAGQGIMTRSHFAQFIVQAGHARNIKSVFKRYMVKGKPGHVAHEWMPLQQAVALIKNSGGIAVIAHPGRYDLGKTNMYELMHAFRSYGGEAIEVVTGSHTPPQYQQFATIAHQFDLMASQGSDYHGSGVSYMDMGQLPALPNGCIPVWHNWSEASLLN